MVVCSYCSVELSCVKVFKIHIQFNHQDAVCLRYKCGETGCSRTFDSWRALRLHLLQFHKCPESTNTIDKPAVVYVQDKQQGKTGSGSPEASSIDDQSVDLPNLSNTFPEFKSSFEKSIQILVAKLYRNPSVSRKFVQTIIDDFDSFICSGFVDIIEDKISSLASLYGLPLSALDDVLDMVRIFKSPFKGLTSEHRRVEYFRSLGHYVPPVSFTICEQQHKLFRTSCGPVIKLVKTTGQFVPFRHLLVKLFELPGALSDTLNYMNSLNNSSPDVVSNYIQGYGWKLKTSKFKDDDIVIPVDYYFDEFEPDSALGPHSDKLGAGYIQIPVLPPSCRSKLENILLVLLINGDDRKSIEVGKVSYNEEVFRPVIDELIYLEKNGIVCNTELGSKKIYFVLGLVNGDNLGVHGVLGCVEGFTANFPCIICRGHKHLIQRMTIEDKSLYRDPVNYAEDVITNNVTETGIKEECAFNRIPSFHIVDNKVVDAMHDAAEGVSHYVMIPVLKHLIDSGYFSIDHLCSRMYFFDYGPHDCSNKPPVIRQDFDDKQKLKMTAVEMLNFVRFLGLLVGDLVPENDEFWHLYCLHRQLIEILQSRHLPRNIGQDISLLVHEHHSLYMELTGRLLPPKFHYLLHYGSVFENSGPFVHFSSMRGEAKHRDLKNYTNVISSRRNLPMSVAIKHQLGMCLRFASQKPLISEIECGPGEVFDVREHPLYDKFKSTLPHIFRSNSDCQSELG